MKNTHPIVNKLVTPARRRFRWFGGSMKKWFLILMLGLLPSVAAAQTVTSVELTIYRDGATTPAVAPTQVPLTAWQCGQTPPPPPSGTVVNPTQFVLPDPANTNLACIYTDPPNGILSLLGYDPVNVYYGVARYVNSAGAGNPSPNSNFFSRPGTTPTVTPAYVRLQRGQ